MYWGVFEAVLFREGEIGNFRILGGAGEQKFSKKNRFFVDFIRLSTLNLVLGGLKPLDSVREKLEISEYRVALESKNFREKLFFLENAIFWTNFTLFWTKSARIYKIFLFIICFEQLSLFFKLVIMIRAAVKAELL